MTKLTIIVGEDVGSSFDLKAGKNILGRASDVDCVLKDLRASRKHSCVVIEGDYCYVLDMNSHNGTYLNGAKVAGKTKVNENDKIGIGAHVLLFSNEKKEDSNSFFGYTMINEVKKSDTGDFWIARQKILERDVLLWRLSREVLAQENEAESKKMQQDFLQQIQSIAPLSHRNILILLDFGITPQFLYCAFECSNLDYNLKRYLQKEKKISITKTIEISMQIATGLMYAHQQNIAHLHLTEKNILFHPENDRVVLTEFGVSKFLSSATATSGQGATTTGILGVSSYISPEQASGKNVTEKADIYSLGCIMYHLLVGQPPFPSKNIYELCNAHCNEEPVLIEKQRSDIPESFSNIIRSCMQKNPDTRPNLQDVLDSLKEIKQKFLYKESIYSDEGKQYLKDKFGEVKLKKWWILGPSISISITIAAFFVVRFFQ